jgi:hypothetical protein
MFNAILRASLRVSSAERLYLFELLQACHGNWDNIQV